jgi:hypothetical protein
MTAKECGIRHRCIFRRTDIPLTPPCGNTFSMYCCMYMYRKAG